jgi:hypothetical protein
MKTKEMMEKFDHLIAGLKQNDIVSDCCSALVWQPTKEWSQCFDCKEYCDAIELSDEDK